MKKIALLDVALAAALIISVYLQFAGITWGLPSWERTLMVFGSKAQVEENISAMLASREQFYGEKNKLGEVYVGQRAESGRPAVYELTKQELLGSVRSFFLGSAIGDETWTISIISRMHPSQLDFNPKVFIYGGAYIYSACFFLVLASLFKIAVLTSSFSYYFLHPEAIAGIFTAFRLLSALSTVLTAVVIYLTFKGHYRKRVLAAAVIIFLTAPVIIYHSHIAKPHAFSMLWATLAFFCFMKIANDIERSRYYILGGIFAGLSAGSLYPNGLIILTLLFAQYRKTNSIKSFFAPNMFKSAAAAAAAFVATNPYMFSKAFLGTFGATSKVWGYGMVSAGRSAETIKLLFSGGVSWAVSILIISGIIAVVMRKNEASRYVLFTAGSLVLFNLAFLKHIGVFTVSLPYLAVIAALGAEHIVSNTRTRYFGGAALCLIFSVIMLDACSSSSLFVKKPIYQTVGEWINSELPKGSSIGLMEDENIRPADVPYFHLFDYRVFCYRNDFLEKGFGGETPRYLVVGEYGLRNGNVPGSQYATKKAFASRNNYINGITRNNFIKAGDMYIVEKKL